MVRTFIYRPGISAEDFARLQTEPNFGDMKILSPMQEAPDGKRRVFYRYAQGFGDAPSLDVIGYKLSDERIGKDPLSWEFPFDEPVPSDMVFDYEPVSWKPRIRTRVANRVKKASQGMPEPYASHANMPGVEVEFLY